MGEAKKQEKKPEGAEGPDPEVTGFQVTDEEMEKALRMVLEGRLSN